MLDIGWTELFVVGIVALIVIGPKDLPAALHTFGKYVGRARRVARQFQDGIDDIARQEELRELQKTVNQATSARPLESYLNGDGAAAKPDAPAGNAIAPPDALPPPPDETPPDAPGGGDTPAAEPRPTPPAAS